jgi:cell shape-determining protein MreC
MKFTPRRSFWILLTTAIISTLVAAREPAVVRPPRNAAAGVLQVVMEPVAWTFTRGQSMLDSVLASRHRREGRVRRLALHYEKIITLLRTRLRVLQNLLHQTRLLESSFPGIQPGTLMAADVDGFSTAGTDTLWIDRGYVSDQQLKAGDPVLAHLSLVGRISSIGPQTSEVTLLTAPSMKETARIIRITNGVESVISRDCLVVGTGLGSMHCELDQSIGSIRPRKGDMVVLSDTDWPGVINGIALGTVMSVEASHRTALRWSLNIAPICDMPRVHHAVILLSTRR